MNRTTKINILAYVSEPDKDYNYDGDVVEYKGKRYFVSLAEERVEFLGIIPPLYTKIKDYLNTLTGQITFRYNNKDCGIDPIARDEFDIWYGDELVTVETVNDAMNIDIFGDKSLRDIFDDITDLEM